MICAIYFALHSFTSSILLYIFHTPSHPFYLGGPQRELKCYCCSPFFVYCLMWILVVYNRTSPRQHPVFLRCRLFHRQWLPRHNHQPRRLEACTIPTGSTSRKFVKTMALIPNTWLKSSEKIVSTRPRTIHEVKFKINSPLCAVRFTWLQTCIGARKSAVRLVLYFSCLFF